MDRKSPNPSCHECDGEGVKGDVKFEGVVLPDHHRFYACDRCWNRSDPPPNPSEADDEPPRSGEHYQVGGTHYTEMGIQPWTIMQAVLTPEEWIGYLKGTALKHAMRQNAKPGEKNDVEKCLHYLDKLKEAKGGAG